MPSPSNTSLLLRSTIGRRFALIVICLGLLLPLRAAWTPVPPVNFTNLSLSQFTDRELEVPYYLNHFAQVANAVVETGTNRGFLDLKVNREPADNQPYNARIQEMQMALAYFYCANRPWNPYYGTTPVRDRLEAMLERWCNIQNQPGSADGDYDGLFAEYSASNWSLAPTGFGTQAAAQTLDLILSSGLPFDTNLLARAQTSLRAALMALFTRSDMRNAARQYSNQLSGSYFAALVYLGRWPDAQLETAFTNTVALASAQDQSPAGFHYEQGGPDFGYSGVHERNLDIALTRLRDRTNLAPVLATLVAADTRWNAWLAANYAPQPGTTPRTFLVNGGINTRTSHAFLRPETRGFAEYVDTSRAFALTDADHAAHFAGRRQQVQAQWGAWGALAVPSSGSYIPGFVYDAAQDLYPWQPSSAQREAAVAALPCFSTNRFARLFHDGWPVSVTTVRRPAYYGVFNSERIRLTRQNYGLGLLWNETFGCALQSVAGTAFAWGTRRTGATSTYEQVAVTSVVTVAGTTISRTPGVTNLPDGDVLLSYGLGGFGSKTVRFNDTGIVVNVTHPGAFSELFPFAHASDAVVSNQTSRVVIQRPNGASCTLTVLTPGASFTLDNPVTLTTGLVRRVVTVTASDSLSYQLVVSSQGPPPLPPPLPSVTAVDAAADQPGSGTGTLLFPVVLSSTSAAPVSVAFATTNGTALAGTEFTSTNGMLTFSPGQTNATVPVTIAAGGLLQGASRTLGLLLSSPSNATLARASATGTIRGTVPDTNPAGGVTITFRVDNDWGAGAGVTFILSNSTAAAINNWTLQFDYAWTLTPYSHATVVSQSGARQVFTNMGYATLPAGGYVSFGCSASSGNLGTAKPSNYVFNGIALGAPALAVATPTLPAASVGSAYAALLTATGGTAPRTWSITAGALPAGLSLSPTGTVSGAPLLAGTSTFTAQVADAANATASRAFTLVVTKGTATVSLGSLSQVANGSPRPVAVNTSPTGLAVSLAYNGAPAPPASPGSYTVTALVTDANYAGSNTATLVLVSAWDAWRATNFSAAELADPARSGPAATGRDGVPLLMKYALGLDPVAPATTQLPALAVNPQQLTFSFPRNTNAFDLVWRVEVTEDLVSWRPLVSITPTGTVTPHEPVTSVTLDPATGRVTLLDAAPSPARPIRLLRLRVLHTP